MGDLISTETTPNDKYATLLARCFGDNEKAERLIKYEFTHHNAPDRAKAIELAIYRLERDNR